MEAVASNPTKVEPAVGASPISSPPWLDEAEYPFEHKTFSVGSSRLHYVDEGRGAPIVFVHGTPTWSFLWRRLILALRGEHRCIAPDHLGFGLSDKPEAADYTPAAHAARLEDLIEHLELRDITLVVHDFGGPIGLSYALRRPKNVKRVVIMNSWLWSNADNPTIERSSRLLSGPVGRFLYRRLNFSARFLLPAAFADRSKLTPSTHRHYLSPFSTPTERNAPWVLARELSGSNEWYAGLWAARGALGDIPALIIWGMDDRLMPKEHLARWQQALPHASVEQLPGVGHFVQEEAAEEVTASLRSFLTL